MPLVLNSFLISRDIHKEAVQWNNVDADIPEAKHMSRRCLYYSEKVMHEVVI